jgi:hypothetical protein
VVILTKPNGGPLQASPDLIIFALGPEAGNKKLQPADKSELAKTANTAILCRPLMPLPTDAEGIMPYSHISI